MFHLKSDPSKCCDTLNTKFFVGYIRIKKQVKTIFSFDKNYENLNISLLGFKKLEVYMTIISEIFRAHIQRNLALIWAKRFI